MKKETGEEIKKHADYDSIFCFLVVFFFLNGFSASGLTAYLDATESDRFCCSVMFNFATPWTVAHQAHLSMKSSRQEY